VKNSAILAIWLCILGFSVNKASAIESEERSLTSTLGTGAVTGGEEGARCEIVCQTLMDLIFECAANERRASREEGRPYDTDKCMYERARAEYCLSRQRQKLPCLSDLPTKSTGPKNTLYPYDLSGPLPPRD
jgi:hypothetical protein